MENKKLIRMTAIGVFGIFLYETSEGYELILYHYDKELLRQTYPNKKSALVSMGRWTSKIVKAYQRAKETGQDPLSFI